MIDFLCPYKKSTRKRCNLICRARPRQPPLRHPRKLGWLRMVSQVTGHRLKISCVRCADYGPSALRHLRSTKNRAASADYSPSLRFPWLVAIEMSSDLLLYLIFNFLKASRWISNLEIIDPFPQNGVDNELKATQKAILPNTKRNESKCSAPT